MHYIHNISPHVVYIVNFWPAFLILNQEVLERTIRLLSFHCNVITRYDKQKKTSVRMRNDVDKTIQYGRLQC
jgi:hypothetical protein